jgi:hypothetical protein
MMRLALVLLFLLPLSAAAEKVDGLYSAEALVTGQRPETRDPGLRQAFRDVLVKVSGDGSLFSDTDAERLFDPALVRGYSYRDLMASLPKKDEQGTRDRPFELTVEFAPDRIDNTLAKLGRSPWGPERPSVTAFIAVELGPSHFTLASDGEPGVLQSRALMAAAERYGLPILLPARSELASGTLAVGPGQKGEMLMTGTMRFDETLPGWRAEWSVAAGNDMRTWQTESPTFDEAFRSAVRDASGIVRLFAEGRSTAAPK